MTGNEFTKDSYHYLCHDIQNQITHCLSSSKLEDQLVHKIKNAFPPPLIFNTTQYFSKKVGTSFVVYVNSGGVKVNLGNSCWTTRIEEVVGEFLRARTQLQLDWQLRY